MKVLQNRDLMCVVLSREKVNSDKHNTSRLICAHFLLFREILVERADKGTWDYMEKRQERFTTAFINYCCILYEVEYSEITNVFNNKEKIIQRRSQFVAYFDLWCFEFRFPQFLLFLFVGFRWHHWRAWSTGSNGMTYFEIFLLLEGVKNKTLHLCLTERAIQLQILYIMSTFFNCARLIKKQKVTSLLLSFCIAIFVFC